MGEEGAEVAVEFDASWVSFAELLASPSALARLRGEDRGD